MASKYKIPKNKKELEEARRLINHIKKLGCKSIAEYRAWCTENNFGDGLYKTEDIRKKETDYLKKQWSLYEEQNSNLFRKNPLTLVRKMLEKKEEIDASKLNLNAKRVYFMLKNFMEENKISINDPKGEELFRFLNSIDKRTNLIHSTESVVFSYGVHPKNMYLSAILKLFLHKDKIINPWTGWKIKSHNDYSQFKSLVKHLFGQYKVPDFLYTTWFGLEDKEHFYLSFARGDSLKSLTFPINLSRKQIFEFSKAPRELNFEEAIRYGQIKALGGDDELVHAINGSIIFKNYENQEFWESVIKFFIKHTLINRASIGGIIDFINHQKFSEAAPRPNFSMEKRSPLTLIAESDAWHRENNRERELGNYVWEKSGIPSFVKETSILGRKNYKKYMIDELNSSKELNEESKRMNHCIKTYAKSCYEDKYDVFSLTLTESEGNKKNLLTIAVDPSRRFVTQVAGFGNRQSTEVEKQILREWAGASGLTYRER